MVRAIRYLLAGGVLAAALVVTGCWQGVREHLFSSSSTPDFNFDVRPILSENCFRCHGPDSGSREAGLRLDIPEAAYAELPESRGKHAIVPGKPEKSELIRRVSSIDPDVRMPPPTAHKTLTPEQVETLRRWVEAGAEYKPHWAYIAPARVTPPETKFDARAVNPIDRFIFARFGKADLSPSAEADRETLINRVTLDLTGLPPSLAEVDAFLADRGENAYEKVVDRLLASPRYGERMASAWMDVARYADSDGYLDDLHGRLLWPWRDWVISAFNRNMPYDQFATWQLAGDLFPNATQEQRLATAFGRLGKRSTENGIIDEEYRVEYMDERTELVGKAFLGLTVGCAKCHDHKYDTISQEDYYSLGAFFNSIDERGFYAAGYLNRTVGPTLAWPDADTSARLNRANAALETQESSHAAARQRTEVRAAAEADRMLKESPAQLRAYVERSLRSATLAWYPLDSSRKPTAAEIETQVKVQRKTFFPSDSPYLRNTMNAARTTATPTASAQPAATQARHISSTPRGSPPNGIVEKLLTLSPSATPGVAPAVLQEGLLKPGKKGQAFYVTDKNIGYLAKNVGWFERTQPFGFALWMKLPRDKVYNDATVVNHRDHNILSGDSGYTLNLEKNHLRFDVIHMSPHNMLSVRSTQPLAAQEWVHVAVMYDGSSDARGVQIYVNGVPAHLEIARNNLTRTILPTLITGVLGGDYYGFSFGFRFRDELFTGGMIDEIHIFNRVLSPLEVKVAYRGPDAIKADASSLKEDLSALVAANDPDMKSAAAALERAREAVNSIASNVPEIMVMGDTQKPRQAYLLERGVYNQRGREVQPRGLDRVYAWNGHLPRNRVGLARWLFDPGNPMTARVTVNRLWAQHFGRGIVETVDDFGTQGSNPTHPELLDWLAVELVQSKWDLKRMHKLMVMSATYRQSSNATQEQLNKDPRNLLLARANRQRLPAEVIRDNALAASGLLVEKMGGASVRPYQPGGVWEAVASRHGYPEASEVPADEHHRRSLYTFIKRSAEAPSMVVFDFADRNVSNVKRPLSNTPLQALVLLNDPQYREAYRVLAQRVLRTPGDTNAHLTQIMRLATRRKPYPQELAALSRYHSGEIARLAKSPEAAKQILAVGVSPVDSTLNPVELAALTSVTAVLMNTPDAYSIR